MTVILTKSVPVHDMIILLQKRNQTRLTMKVY